MAYGLYLVAENLLVGHEESVELGGGRHAEVPVIDVVESVHRIYALLLVGNIPRALLPLEVHAVSEIECRVDVQEPEEREVAADGYDVLDAVAPVARQARLHDLVLLGSDGVGDVAGIAHGDLLVPPFLAHHVLALEGIEARDADVQVGESHGDGRVAHVLLQVHGAAQRHADAGEAGAPRHGAGTRRLGAQLWVVHRREVVLLVARGGKVDTGRQRAVGVGLGILTVAPLHLEAGGLLVVGHVLLAIDGILETDVHRAVELVALAVVGGCRDAPRALGIDFAQQLEVHLVVHGKVIATVAQVEAARELVAVGGHDESRGIALGEGEEAIGNGKGQRHVGHHEIGRSEHHVLAGAHLGSRHGEIEVRMGLVAGGVAAVVEVHLAIAVALRQLRGHEAVVLLGVGIADDAFLRLEVEGHRVGLVGIAAHLEHRGAKLHTGRIDRTRGMHQTGVELHVYLVAVQVHVLILHVGLAEEAGQSGGSLVGH